MKKNVQYLALAATALLMFSCSSDITDNGDGNSNGSISVKATQEQLTEDDSDGKTFAPSRTVLDPTTNKVTWKEGDAINIFDGERNAKFAATSAGSTVTFTSQGGVRDNASRFVALYPYNIAATYTDGTISNVTLPYCQNAVANSYDPTCALMTASTTDMGTTLAFKHVCSYVKFSTDFDCTRVVLKFDRPVAGKFDITVADDGTPTVSNVKSTDGGTAPDSIVVVGDINKDTDYYVAVLPGTEGSSFSMTLDPKPTKEMVNTTTKTINVASHSKHTDKALATTRAKIRSVGTLTWDGTDENRAFTIPYEDMGIGDDIATATTGHTVLWAKINLGASSEEKVGNYYAWGETKPKSVYTKDTYLCNDYYPTSLDAAHDAATTNWGHGWRMPTHADFEALKKNCIFVYVAEKGFYVYRGNGDIKDYQKMDGGKVYRYATQQGVAGRDEVSDETVVSYINNLSPETVDHLFIPFGGHKSGEGGGQNDAARYWMNDHGTGDLYSITVPGELTSYYWGLASNAFNTWSCWRPRYEGLNIRPVFEIEW